MHIDQGFLIKHNILSYRLQERFLSKQNAVSLVSFIDRLGKERQWVVKRYSSPEGHMEKEAEILTLLYKEGLTVPEVIYAGETNIVMRHIKGITMLEWMEGKEQEAVDARIQGGVLNAVEELTCWLKNFYAIMAHNYGESVILGDVNLRNFILADRIYGVDFENCRQGKIEEDIGKLCAFALTYDPPYTRWKCLLVSAMKEIMSGVLQLSEKELAAEIDKELHEMGKRRKTIFPGSPQEV